MQAPLFHPERRRPRAGFSLVELLIVISIIVILFSLAFVVLGRSAEAAREAATRSAMRVLSGALRDRIEAFQDATAGVVNQDPDVPIKLKNRIFRARVEEFYDMYAAASNSTSITPVQAEVFVRKAMFKEAFPQRLEDLYGYDGVPGRDDSPMLLRMSGTPSSSDWSSSELLYLTLTQGDVFGLPPGDIEGIDQNLIGDTDSDGRLELLDGWGRLLRFYNWPTRLIKDNGTTYVGTVTVGSTTYPTASLLISNLPKAGATGAASATTNRNRVDRDPGDITRSLTSSALLNSFNLNRGAGAYPAQPFTAVWYHDLNTGSSPLIVSAGPDGVLGLHEPTESGSDRLCKVINTDDSCQALSDNITNQQRGPQ